MTVIEARAVSSAPMIDILRADSVLRAEVNRRLGIGEKARLAVEVVVVYARVRRTIRMHAVPELLTSLRGGVEDRGVPAWEVPHEHVTAVRLARAVVRVMARLPGDTRCLTKALVLITLLARRRVGSKLLIAVAPGEQFAAHAWVEHGGLPVLPADGPGFGRLVEL